MANHGATATQKYLASLYPWESNTTAGVEGFSYGENHASVTIANELHTPKVKIWNGTEWVLAPSA